MVPNGAVHAHDVATAAFVWMFLTPQISLLTISFAWMFLIPQISLLTIFQGLASHRIIFVEILWGCLKVCGHGFGAKNNDSEDLLSKFVLSSRQLGRIQVKT